MLGTRLVTSDCINGIKQTRYGPREPPHHYLYNLSDADEENQRDWYPDNTINSSIFLCLSQNSKQVASCNPTVQVVNCGLLGRYVEAVARALYIVTNFVPREFLWDSCQHL